MTLTKFLVESTQSHAREEILNHKLLFDLKVAAGTCGYHLQNYSSDVDHEGFDVVLDDGVNLRKMQVKSVGRYAKTAKWDIHRGLLLPAVNNLEPLGFQYKSLQSEEERPCWGADGGVILIVYEVKGGEIEVAYRYTDVYIISAISLGILKRPKPTIAVAKKVRTALPQENAAQTLEIRKGLFVEAATPQHLLCLLGMKSLIKRNWQMRVRAIANEEWASKGEMLQSELGKFRSEFPAILQEVSGRKKP
jgi:hypothetical protein